MTDDRTVKQLITEACRTPGNAYLVLGMVGGKLDIDGTVTVDDLRMMIDLAKAYEPAIKTWGRHMSNIFDADLS